MKRRLRDFALALVLLVLLAPAGASAQKNRAEGFSKLPAGAKIALPPIDIELFEISAGGVEEPRADWTKSALQHVRDLLAERKAKLGAQVVELEDDGSEQLAELNRLHGAVGAAILTHHFGELTLETKNRKLEWTLGAEADVLRRRSGADYALFTYIRDSYASGDRIATMIVGLLFGQVLFPGAGQLGYASLVDLRTGQIVWFNRMLRMTGDLRQRDKAAETVDALLNDFPK